MTASPTLLLSAYCIAIAGFSLVGGLLPNWVRMTHTRTQLVMSFVSGLMLGVAFYYLLPHSVAMVGGPDAVDSTVWWLMIGLIVMLLLLRLFHFHQHDFSSEQDEHRDHNHQSPESGAHRLSWIGIALGLALHTLIDGVALGAIMQGESVAGITAVMEAGGWSRRARATTNLLFALMCPLGALLFFFGVDLLADTRSHVVAAALAFSAGAFICIALSDLLPEVHFHSHDRAKLTLAFLLGIGLAYGMGSVEHASAHLDSHVDASESH